MAETPDNPWKNLTGLNRLTFSFRVAFQGIWTAFKTQQNFRIHLCVSIAVFVVSALSGLTRGEWLTLIACIAAVLAAELFNTALEGVVDLVCPTFDSRAGAIKDISAAGVLVVCLAAALIGACILLPRLLAVINSA